MRSKPLMSTSIQRPALAALTALALAATLSTLSCRGRALRGKSAGGEAILAQIDDITITSKDMREVLARYASQPFVLARYSSIEKKKELLDSMIRFQVLALEARKRGYDSDPEVVRVAKDKMVKLFTQQEVVDKVQPSDVTPAEVESYYRKHASDYLRPETVRVSEIVVKGAARAAKVLAEAKALDKTDMKSFRELVTRHSEDVDSRQRAGDLMQFDRKTTLYPAAVVAAAFALKQIGDLSEPVSTPNGLAILKLTERHPAVSRSLEDSRAEITRHLLEDLRNQRKKKLVDEARQQIKIEIFEDELAKLDLAGSSTNLDGGMLGATL